ncbi:MAG: DUF1801 domain-containing protein [Flavobacterium sp.]|nr:DUF1801 domain-containing protein [Flavobacterium sp.]
MSEEAKKHVWDKTGNWNTELNQLTNLLEQAKLEKTIKWGAPVYTYKGKNVVGIAGFKHFFALWFFNGVALSDPANVLINAQEGKTKKLRQWRFTKQEQIDEPLIMQYLLEAMALE